jgi:DHA1 family multidrug resistance protein-like MFS transporter
MLLRSMMAITVFTALMGLCRNPWQFLAVRMTMGALSGFSASALTLVASQMPGNRLGFALGWLSTSQLVGGLAGPMLGGAVADLSGSTRAPYFVTSALAGLATMLALLFVREQFTPGAAASKKQGALAGLKMVMRSPMLLPLFFVLLLAQFGVRTVQPIVTLYVQSLAGNVPNLATLAGLAFSVTGLADLMASPFLGKRSDVLGYRRVLIISLAGAAAFSAPQAFAPTYWAFVAMRFGVGLFIGGVLPTANALIGRLVPAERRGTVYGMTASATFLGNSLGPVTGGAVAALLGLHWVFLFTGGLLAINLIWTWRAVPASVDRAGVESG